MEREKYILDKRIEELSIWGDLDNEKELQELDELIEKRIRLENL
jgi:hypothetical protein